MKRFEMIDQQFRNLRIAVFEQDGLQQSLEEAQSRSKDSSFQKNWSPLGSSFNDLRQYCGGITNVMPRTSCVESTFSLINWTKDPNSKQLTDFSLEAILHCKQYGMLQELLGQQWGILDKVWVTLTLARVQYYPNPKRSNTEIY